MERLEGETLAARLARGPLPVAEVLVLGAQLAGRARRGPPPRHRPPRPQARQRHAHPLGGQAARLRPRAPRRGRASGDGGRGGDGHLRHRGPAADPGRHARGDVALSRPGAGAGAPGRRAQRPLRPRLRAPRGAHRPARLPGRDPQEITAAILGTEPPDLREAAPGTPAAARRARAAVPRQGPRRAVAVRRRRGARPSPGRGGRGTTPARGPARVATSRGGRSPSARWASPRPPAPRPPSRAPPAGGRAPALRGGRLRPGCSCRGRRWELRSRSRPTVAGSCSAAARAAPSSLWLWSAEDGQTPPARGHERRHLALLLARRAGDRLLRRRRSAARAGRRRTGDDDRGAPVASSGTWGSGGTILFTRPIGADAGIYSVPARGGEPRPIAPAPSPRERRGFVRFLPDGRHYLFLKALRPVRHRSPALRRLRSTAGSPTASRAASRRPSTRARVTSSAFAPGRSSRCPSTPEAAGPREMRSRSRGTSGGSARAAPRPSPSRPTGRRSSTSRGPPPRASPGSTGSAARRPLLASPPLSACCSSRPMAVGSWWTGAARRAGPRPLGLRHGLGRRDPPDLPVDRRLCRHLVAGRPEPRLCEGRGRAPRRHRAPSRRDGTRGGAPARPGRPAPEALVSRRPAHRLRRLLAGPARPADSSGCSPSTERPVASPRRRRAATTAASRPTGGASPTSPRSRAGRRSTSLLCRVARPGGSRARAACCRAGGPTGRSSSSSSLTA